jgi:hypothetical protein
MAYLDGRDFGRALPSDQTCAVFYFQKLTGELMRYWMLLPIPLAIIVYLATLPTQRMDSTLDILRRECNGDEACAQKKWADWQFNMADDIEKKITAAIARQDAKRNPQ